MGDETRKPDFTSVQGTVTSTPPDRAARVNFSNVKSRPGSMIDESSNYIVEKDDNLSKIAKRFYGDAKAWKSIFEANRDQLVDPDRIKPGQILRIPPNPLKQETSP